MQNFGISGYRIVEEPKPAISKCIWEVLILPKNVSLVKSLAKAAQKLIG